MAKIVIEIRDNKTDTSRCDVKISVPKSDNATDTEKNMLAVVYNSVCNALNTLQKNQK